MSRVEFAAGLIGERIDSLISEHTGQSRSMAAKWCAAGLVTVNGRAAQKSCVVCAGDIIAIDIPEPEPAHAVSEDIPLDIIYEDGYLLVVNKPKGMVVHPAAGNHSGTLVNALLHHCGSSLSGIGGVIRPGIVHRLDKDTAGLLIVAKHDAAHNMLAAQIKDHSFLRRYEAVCRGRLTPESGTINGAIGRHKQNRKRMALLPDNDKTAKSARTDYETLRTGTIKNQTCSHVRLTLHTGRTHQIRVHLAHLGHPVLDDTVYGKKDGLANGQCLFARELGFTHPDGRYMRFEAPLPEWFNDVLKKLT